MSKNFKKKLSFFFFFFLIFLCKEKLKTLSLYNGRKKKKNWILYSQTTNFNSHSHSWYMFLGSSCAFFLHIKGMSIPFKFHQVLFISRLFFLAQLPLKTLALSRIARLCQMNSYQQINHLCQITNSFFFLWLLHPGYISWVLDYLGSDWTQKR